MEVSGHFHVPAALSPRKEPLLPIGYEAVGPRAVVDAEVSKNFKTFIS